MLLEIICFFFFWAGVLFIVHTSSQSMEKRILQRMDDATRDIMRKIETQTWLIKKDRYPPVNPVKQASRNKEIEAEKQAKSKERV